MSEWLTRVDLWIIVIYLGAMLMIAVRAASGSRDLEGYIVGNRSMSGIVLGVSVLGTFLSSITFLGLPAKTFKGNWNAMVFGLALPFAALVATQYFVPLYRRRTRLSAFELLSQRFGAWARVYADLSYLLLQAIRIGTVLLLVAFSVAPLLQSEGPSATAAMASSNNTSVMIGIVLTLGVLVIIYDTLGGIRAVIWTDVLQVIILMFGACWCLGQMIIAWKDGGFFASVPTEKISLGAWTNWNSETNAWDWTIPSVMVVFIYGLTENLRNYGSDQNYVQRMLAAKSDRAAANSIWIGALTYVPVSVIFCLLGTALWMNTQLDQPTLPAGIEADQAFPYFIRHALPRPIAGLVIAAVLAAAMSTVDSSLNSCSTILYVDILRPLKILPKGASEIVAVRTCTVIFGILGTSMAIGLLAIKGQDESKVLMDLWWQYAGTAGGGMFGLFLLAWLMPRIPSWSAAMGVALTIPFLVWGTFAQAGSRADWLPASIPDCRINPLLIGVFATGIILAVGGLCQLGIGLGWLRENRRYEP